MTDPVALEEARRERIRAIRARHYAKYAERYRAQSKAWRTANQDKVKASNAARNWKRGMGQSP